MRTRIFALFFLTGIVVITGFLLTLSIQNEKPGNALDMPEFSFTNASGPARLEKSTLPVIVVYFHLTCEHCRYQLTVFDRHTDHFKDIYIYFLTSQSDFFATFSGSEWENLTQAENVIFGITPKEVFRQHFGSVVTPSLFFFNDQGKFMGKLLGEAKASKILETVNSLMSGRAQSRHN